MCDHRHPTAFINPIDSIGQRSPLVRHVTRPAVAEKVLECRWYVLDHALLYEKSRKVGTTNNFRVIGKSFCTFETSADAKPFEHRRNIMGALGASDARCSQSGPQLRISGVYAKAQDVQSLTAPSHRNLDAVNQFYSMVCSRTTRHLQATGFIVVGQCERGDVAHTGARQQFVRT